MQSLDGRSAAVDTDMLQNDRKVRLLLLMLLVVDSMPDDDAIRIPIIFAKVRGTPDQNQSGLGAEPIVGFG